MRPHIERVALALAALCMAACDDSAPTTTAPSSTTAAVTATAAATASAAPAHPLEGSWSGAYDATRGEVEIPKGAKKYDSWKKDDGKAHTGKGSVELRVASDGEVSGTAKGALGPLQIRGRVEDGELRAGVTPSDPGAGAGMHGVLTGTAKADEIDARLRVASHDAALVRASRVQLSRR